MNALSVCVIAKNEAECIAGMISSVQALSNDILIVDTGSSDNTLEISQSLGARTEHYQWNNDFSAARNYSISLARNPWILILDADEQLDPSAINEINSYTQKHNKAFALKRIHYLNQASPGSSKLVDTHNPAISLGAVAYYETHDFRLFPKDPRVQYEGLVHESAEDSLRNAGFEMEYTSTLIHHYGHLASAEKKSNKNKFYLSLAMEKLSRDPSDWRNSFQVASELQALERHNEAIEYFKNACSLNSLYDVLWRQLGISQLAVSQPYEALLSLKEAFAINDSNTLTWLALAGALIATGNNEHAKTLYSNLLSVEPNNEIALKKLAELG